MGPVFPVRDLLKESALVCNLPEYDSVEPGHRPAAVCWADLIPYVTT